MHPHTVDTQPHSKYFDLNYPRLPHDDFFLLQNLSAHGVTDEMMTELHCLVGLTS